MKNLKVFRIEGQRYIAEDAKSAYSEHMSKWRKVETLDGGFEPVVPVLEYHPESAADLGAMIHEVIEERLPHVVNPTQVLRDGQHMGETKIELSTQNTEHTTFVEFRPSMDDVPVAADEVTYSQEREARAKELNEMTDEEMNLEYLQDTLRRLQDVIKARNDEIQRLSQRLILAEAASDRHQDESEMFKAAYRHILEIRESFTSYAKAAYLYLGAGHVDHPNHVQNLLSFMDNLGLILKRGGYLEGEQDEDES